VDLQLTGRRALVTGGSRGIGKAVAAALLAEGAEVAIAARDLGRLNQAAAELGAVAGRAVPAVGVDTGDAASVRQLAAAAQDRLGGVDILVNCAARPAGQAPPLSLPEITGDAFWSDVNVKVLGHLRCAQAVAPGMVAAGWGRIISVSGLAALSTGSVIGSIRNVAVSAMTKNLADELGPSGVNVNAVHPGLTRTEATPGVLAAQAAAAGVEPAEIERRMAHRNLTRTLIDASQVAAVIAFLASPLSVSINGESIAAGAGPRELSATNLAGGRDTRSFETARGTWRAASLRCCHQSSQWITTSGSGRAAGLKSVPLVYASGVSTACATVS
jgi:NAD(P)-dependent dehydrogenase (short-subunit alcohol dehydrogenase family)